MLYREIITVYSQIHTKHINTQCRQNVELLNVKLAVHTVTTGLLLLLLALQPTMGFSLLSDSLPFYSFFTLVSPPSYSHYLHILFDICNPSLPWSPSNFPTYSFSL